MRRREWTERDDDMTPSPPRPRAPLKRRVALRADPEKAKEWQRSSRKAIGKRKGKQRRVSAPLPVPRGEPVRLEDVREPGVAFGPQAELCRDTLCCVCFSLWWRRVYGSRPIKWTALPTVEHDGQRSEAHHEPPRSLRADSDDDDTIPLCSAHHTGGFVARHASQWSAKMGEAFWRHFGVRWQAVRDEMRRRVKSLAATAAKGEGSPAALVPVVGEPGPVLTGGPAPASIPPSTWLPPETARSRR